ncbi:MAG TPA: hypothetical protein DD733_09930 [Clostridiales bacterium]|nr:hypothetical protein [Clostridiales bacterium]
MFFPSTTLMKELAPKITLNRRHYKATPDEIRRAAIGNGKKVTVLDYFKIKRAALGTYKIE